MSLKHSDKSEELKTIPSKSWRILKECFRNPKEWQEMFRNPKNPSWREIFIYLNSPWLTSLNLFFIIHFRFVVWVCDWILRVLFFFPGKKKFLFDILLLFFVFCFFFCFFERKQCCWRLFDLADACRRVVVVLVEEPPPRLHRR